MFSFSSIQHNMIIKKKLNAGLFVKVKKVI